jgi:hypothetical protein
MAQKDNKQKWADATRDILLKIDIAQAYRDLGVDVCGSKPNAKGWIEARAFGVEDRTPSAAICITDGPGLGRYKDFRDGTSLGLFDFAATKAGKFAGDWREARKHYARQAAVELPNGEDETTADRFDFSDLTAGTMLLYSKAKPGVTIQSIKDCGGRQARWPKKLAADKTNHLIAFPMYGSALLDLEPTGWHCVPQKATGKIRQFQGQGHEDRLLDKMTAGEYGLMNVDALSRLADADVVNVVEGISDLLAAQAVLGDWRNADPDGRKHVVLSSGACTYHPKPEWMQHFADKEVRLWFDVGDAKNEGQIAAAVWVAALLPVATVRNVQLPLGAEGSKNDLRAWLVGDPARGLPPHNYTDMLAYAETFPLLEQADASAGLSPGEAILKNLGLTVIGEHEGRQAIEIYSESCRKSATLHDIDKLSIAKLMQLVGGEVVETFVHDGKECPPGKFQLKDVRNAIASNTANKQFFGDEKFGAGIWEHDGQLVLVKAKEIGLLNGKGHVELSHVPFVNGRILDCGRGSGEWYDLAVVNRHLASARDHAWCSAVIQEAYQTFAKWNWRQAQQAPTILVGLVIVSWLQSIWQWRPQVFVTGNSNTGKTKLLQETIAYGMFGGPTKLGLFVEKPTEAAISQAMKHHSRVIFVDEFEKDSHRQKVLELFRTTSRGGIKIRGTADHRGVQFRLQHLPWLSAIETGLSREADRNRYIILELDEITDEKRAAFSVPSTSYLTDMGMKLLAIGLAHYQEARRLSTLLQDRQFEKVPPRCVESLALPCAMLAAAGGFTDEEAGNLLGNIVSGWDFEFQQSSDHIDCLSTILTSPVDLPRGEKRNVSTLLKDVQGPDVIAALNRVGVRRVRKHPDPTTSEFTYVLWICPDVASRTLLRMTKYEGHSIDQYLMRLPGSKRSRQRLGGDERFSGVEIPLDTVLSLFKVGDADDLDTRQDGDF